MAKTEVYSWRISRETRAALEMEARREGIPVAALMDRMAREWLEARRSHAAGDQREQERLHRRVAKTVGTIAGGNPRRAETARAAIRARLTGRHDR